MLVHVSIFYYSEIGMQIPPNLDENATEQRYVFKNSFSGATTICEYRKNEVSAARFTPLKEFTVVSV
jgi:hypothetical protein